LPDISMTPRVLCALSFLCFSSVSLTAQESRPAGDPRAAMQGEATRAMAPFAWLVGEWEGPATIHMDNGGTMMLVQHETVTSAAFGTALLIRGRGRMTINGAERVVFEAAGILGYDVPSKKLSFASASGSGQMQMFGVTAQGNGFTWGFTDPRGVEHRYVITRTADGKWHEIGTTSSDGGKTWTTTVELSLTKAP
jgi:hypothetical protein